MTAKSCQFPFVFTSGLFIGPVKHSKQTINLYVWNINFRALEAFLVKVCGKVFLCSPYVQFVKFCCMNGRLCLCAGSVCTNIETVVRIWRKLCMSGIN